MLVMLISYARHALHEYSLFELVPCFVAMKSFKHKNERVFHLILMKGVITR